MIRILEETEAHKAGWTKVVMKRADAWEWIEDAMPWCRNYKSKYKFCMVGFGKFWYFENPEDALFFKLKFG